MTLENAIDKFLHGGVQWFTEYGAYVDSDYDLIFSKQSYYDAGFDNGYYEPAFKKWLFANATLRKKGV